MLEYVGTKLSDTDVVFVGSRDESQTIYEFEDGKGNVINTKYYCFERVFGVIACEDVVVRTSVGLIVDGETYDGVYGPESVHLSKEIIEWWVDNLQKIQVFSDNNIIFYIDKDLSDDENIYVSIVHGKSFGHNSLTGLAHHYARAPRFLNEGVWIIKAMVDSGLSFITALQGYLQLPYLRERQCVGVANNFDNNLPLGLIDSFKFDGGVIKPYSLKGIRNDAHRIGGAFYASEAVDRSGNEYNYVAVNSTEESREFYSKDKYIQGHVTITEGWNTDFYFFAALEGYEEGVSFKMYVDLIKEVMDNE